MKKSDIAAVVLIAGVATVLAFILANVFLGDPSDEKVQVEYMDVISSEIAQPDEELFNAQAINPTVETYVGKCKDGETWDGTAGACVSNNPDGSTENEEGDEDKNDEDADVDGDTDGDVDDTTDEPTTPEE